jgi:hypothetical protein
VAAQREGGRIVMLMGEAEASVIKSQGSSDGNQPIAVVVGNTVYVHAGLLPEHMERGLDALNRQASAWGRSGEVPKVFRDPRGPLLIPDYTYAFVPKPTCERLSKVLRSLMVDRLVAAHALQKGGISAACNRRLYRVDVGLSRPGRAGRLEVLEVTPAGARTLRPR